MKLTRNQFNPILSPDSNNEWESFATFNGNVFKKKGAAHMVYRAMSEYRRVGGKELRVSSIGHAVSQDGVTFQDRSLLIRPERPWDRFGCEDPRAVHIDGKTIVFYTAIGAYPFVSSHIRVGVAIFDSKPEYHLVTPFNAKAMAMFSEKINGKYAVILSANTDLPPATVGVAMFDQLEELWSNEFWTNWYQQLAEHALPLQRLETDQIEVGAAPVKVKEGWLLIYCRIQNYGKPNMIFGIEAALLDGTNPKKVLARSQNPLLIPKEGYEVYGTVPNVIFPSGAIIVGEELRVYYGGADTVCALATCHLPTLMKSLMNIYAAF